MTLSTFCDLFVFVWLTAWAVVAGRSLLKGQSHSANFMILTHFVLLGIPALLNLMIGKPVYLSFPNFDVQDPNVDFVYTIYVSVCPIIWWYFGKSKSAHIKGYRPIQRFKYQIKLLRRFRFILYVLAFSPVLVVLWAPSPLFYNSYAAIVCSPLTDEILEYHKWILAATLFSVLAIAGIWSLSRRILLSIFCWAPMLLITFWLSGKRFVVLLAVALLFIVVWEKRILTGWKLGTFASFAVIGVALFSYSYQMSIRSTDLVDAVKKYENFRIDYGRDHGIKYAIYCELNPQQTPILEYRGESVLFDFTMFIPRYIWPDKPWPYAIYSTAAGQGVPVQDLGWTVTASCLEQAVAECGLYAIFVAPLLLAFTCRIGDSSQNTLVRFLTIVFTCLMLAMTGAFSIIKVAWLFAVFLAHLKRKRLPKISQISYCYT